MVINHIFTSIAKMLFKSFINITMVINFIIMGVSLH